ncbi:MAG: polysaccharide pyruvyl transferase family protein [Parabacteroides sp.]|nr:polysaccharide pyruvyl transferase family protein [Parabacteroides sp.]
MKQIIVVGDNSSTNLGDPILTQSTFYIIKRLVDDRDYKVSIFDIADRKTQAFKVTTSLESISSIKQSSYIVFIFKNLFVDIKAIVKWFIKDKRLFIKRLEKCIHEEKIKFVIAGGALISSSLFYALRLNAIINVAKRHNGQVIFNAIGIEKTIYNYGFAKYIVRHFLKQPQVVSFSTRDHVEDISYLTNRKEFQIQSPDSGIFAAEAFDVCLKKTDLIGLSVISYQAYESVMLNDERIRNLTPENLFSFWEGILRNFISTGQNFKIFTNGGVKDYEMGLLLCKRMKLDPTQYLLPMATNPKQLVKQFSLFRFVIAHRLHALIISTSLGIPVVPIVWSDKVVSFAKMIDNPYAQYPSFDNNISQLVNTVSFDNNILYSLQKKIIAYLQKSIL